MKNIVIIGPPGSGKDTQIEKLRKFFDFEVIATGEIARELAEKNKKIRDIVDSGGLIEDKILVDEISRKLDGLGSETGVVFDGFPRTLHQADLLSEVLLHHNRILDHVIYIRLEEDVVVQRLSRRFVCSRCGHNVMFDAEKCSECGGRPVRRHDDEPAVIIRRMQNYLENTLPLISYYRNKNILIEIDGDQTIADVARDIQKELGYEGQ